MAVSLRHRERMLAHLKRQDQERLRKSSQRPDDAAEFRRFLDELAAEYKPTAEILDILKQLVHSARKR